MKTPYYIDYIINKNQFGTIESAYYQLVRTIDDMILYSNEIFDNILLDCFHRGISKNDIVVL